TDEVHCQPADWVVEEIATHRVRDYHHGEKCHTSRENQTVNKNDESCFFQVAELRMFNFPVHLGHGFLATHGENGVAEANQNANQADGVREGIVTEPVMCIAGIVELRECSAVCRMCCSYT